MTSLERQPITPSSLALLVTGILADNPDNSCAPDNPAIVANLFD